MEQGPVEQRILRDCQRALLPIPARIRDAPELRFGLQFFMEAFNDLHSCRPPSFSGVAAIPWTAVHDYCVRLGIVGEQEEDLHYHIRTLDEAFRKYHEK